MPAQLSPTCSVSPSGNFRCQLFDDVTDMRFVKVRITAGRPKAGMAHLPFREIRRRKARTAHHIILLAANSISNAHADIKVRLVTYVCNVGIGDLSLRLEGQRSATDLLRPCILSVIRLWFGHSLSFALREYVLLPELRRVLPE